MAPRGPSRGLPGAAALIVLAASLAATTALAQQQAPRKLFPDARPPEAAEQPPAGPLADPLEPPAAEGIWVGSLDPPTLAALGLRAAEEELGGPLWPAGAPPELEFLISRLPAEVGEPTLRALQTALLQAPGPPSGAGEDLFLLRVDRLLAMAEADTALELLALVPEGSQGDEVEARRLLARLAADQVEPTCAAVEERASVDPPWPRARIVCAALAGDAATVEFGLDLLKARGGEPDPVLAGLARAAVADTDRYNLAPPVADDPALLPLVRRVPLDVDPGVAAELPFPVRRALADNPNLAAAARAAAVGAPRPGPSIRAELNGRPPPSWADALAAVPPGLRPAWLALADGLGLEVPEPVWAEVYRTAPGGGGNPAPDLFLWRGLEQARLQGQRGAVLLHALLLLGGRPEAASPVALRRALDAFVGLGLDRPAAAVAAGTGGALGL